MGLGVAKRGAEMARLLVVDDEPDMRDLIAQRMVQAGHEVLAADEAPSALALIGRHGPPDAAILDVDLPGMSGLDLLDELRRRHPGLPALFLTVLWNGEIATRMQAAGAGFLAKPFRAAHLLTAVQRLLDGHTAAGDDGGDP